MYIIFKVHFTLENRVFFMTETNSKTNTCYRVFKEYVMYYIAIKVACL